MTKDFQGCGAPLLGRSVVAQETRCLRRKRGSMSDDDLWRRVVAELSGDPRVDIETFRVLAVGSTVILRGTVPSLRVKRAAARAAERVRGVGSIVNELTVRLPAADHREDEDLRGDVLEALMLDVAVPMTVDARVRNGLVTLTGTTQWHYQREAAESRTANVPGVVGIDNAVSLTQAPDAHAAREAITGALRRNAALAAAELSVETCPGGLVTLSGAVSSWAARDQAVAAAWAAPGVTQVDDQIRVVAPPPTLSDAPDELSDRLPKRGPRSVLDKFFEYRNGRWFPRPAPRPLRAGELQTQPDSVQGKPIPPGDTWVRSAHLPM